MFKKLKDKLAEEVKSSPQRIQQFAQAAQAAVTSASSSISDITNSDLFSIGDNDGQQLRPTRLQPSPSGRQNAFQDVSLAQSAVETSEYTSGQEILDNQRHRRLSNSSLASDVSFRLPSYETPSMYHLQSDMEVSASEAEERGFASGTVSLDRVTKEQLYAAYRRTQERYKKYRTQYGDLARHYKLLERENAKARSVLVETQDKALRRISELKEQCSLEQSAKAHLEKALRIEIEEKNMVIDSLNMKVNFLQNNTVVSDNTKKNENIKKDTVPTENCVQLINLTNDNEIKSSSEDPHTLEVGNLHNKIEKMEQLLNKYKESLKNSKDKNSQVVTELQILSNELENKNKEIDQYKDTAKQLNDTIQKIQDLSNINEDLQNKINTYDFTKTKEMSELEIDLQRAKEEISQLQSKIEVFSKREEEYAISLAENKLSIHKELENKEAEIKSLKDSLSSTQKEVQSLNIVINDYKANIITLEDERSKLINENKDYNSIKSKNVDLVSQLEDLTKKYQFQEQVKAKGDEEYKCLQLQLKQETAEKLAMIDRNVYLENKNKHLSEENEKKSLQLNALENELLVHKKTYINMNNDIEQEQKQLSEELEIWKSKYNVLESEIQEEREELVKLQSEIEKLLNIHELTQKQNIELREANSDMKTSNGILQDQINNNDRLKAKLKHEVSELRNDIHFVSSEVVSLKKQFSDIFLDIEKNIMDTLVNFNNKEIQIMNKQYEALKIDNNALQQELKNTTEHSLDTSKVITLLRDENNNLKDTILKLESEKDSINEVKINVQNLYEAALSNIEALKHEQKELVCKIQENANRSKNLEAALDLEKTNNLSVGETLDLLQNENKDLASKLTVVDDKNKCLIKEIEKLKLETGMNVDKLSIIMKENQELQKKSDELDHKIIYINNLQDNIKVLSEENISLKKQIEKIAGNIKDLEAEIIEVRKSHADMEIEKDRLCNIIEKLESKENIISDYLPVAKSTQTDEPNENFHVVVTPELSNSNDTSKNETAIKMLPDGEYLCLKNENDALKDENRRLQSDVEGLQKYLTKISKENSALNDKLRELIATSEHLTENNHFSSEFTELKNEVQTNKDKIESLMRENSLLIEENYELKDQLQNQNYTSPTENKNINNNENDLELSDIKERYKNLVQSNTNTEHKLVDLEQLNRSLNSNIQQIQGKNEKLKMTNEKLERKLDEALVSLRHLHSLQENTELEYLRNILYEYLTGSGMHSITLAKVLSAIVKFDDSQTQLVLQKEKERQGFLRQLGLI